jgi:signal transduction histidine kinase
MQRTDRAILDAQDEIFEFQSMGRDITERKKMENQLLAAQSHLVQAARMATIGEMASGVAHQIYNPLTTIIADAQILLRSIPPEEPTRESAQAIEQAGWRLQKVVQRLMEFSRPSSEAMTGIAINETIHSALGLVSTHIEETGCRIETQLQQEIPTILGNARQLENLWIYLLLLARDACRDGRGNLIRVHSKSEPGDGSFIVVEISDNGTPIPRDQLSTIFEPNFVGPTSGRGTGMELSICREIVRQHDGQITVDSSSTAASSSTADVEENSTHNPPVHDTIFRVALPAAVMLRSDQDPDEITATE